jgi:hypothetical protein
MPEMNNLMPAVKKNNEGGNLGSKTEREDESSFKLDNFLISPSPREERKQQTAL